MTKILFLLAIEFCLLQNLICQIDSSSRSDCLRTNAVIEGRRFENNHYFKFFAILLQDTCSTYNRFTNYFYSKNEPKNNLPPKYYKAVIVDTALVIESEKAIKYLNVDLYRCIRLYAGFVNEENDLFIVVQFVSRKGYRRNKYYSKQMDLVADKNRNLYFIVLSKGVNGLIVEKYFPNDFLR
jgi:hypothetical protein